jgi:hypothetical protein
VKAEIKNKAWLRRQIAAAADAELLVNLKPFVPITNPEFTQCSHAMQQLANTRDGQRLSLPSACLPPLH